GGGVGFAILLLLLPAAHLALADFFGNRMGADEDGRVVDHAEELGEVFAEDIEPRLANLTGLRIAAAVCQDEEMISVPRLLELGRIRPRADGREELLEENGRLSLRV